MFSRWQLTIEEFATREEAGPFFIIFELIVFNMPRKKYDIFNIIFVAFYFFIIINLIKF